VQHVCSVYVRHIMYATLCMPHYVCYIMSRYPTVRMICVQHICSVYVCHIMYATLCMPHYVTVSHSKYATVCMPQYVYSSEGCSSVCLCTCARVRLCVCVYVCMCVPACVCARIYVRVPHGVCICVLVAPTSFHRGTCNDPPWHVQCCFCACTTIEEHDC